MIAQLGIFDRDPIQQLGGLVNLLHGLNEPQMQERELGLREASMQQQNDQFDQQLMIDEQRLAQSAQSEEQAANRWTQEFTMRKDLAAQARLAEERQFSYGQEEDKRRMNMGLLGLPYQFAQADQPFNIQALAPAFSALGIAGALTPPQAATPQYKGAGKLNIDQKSLSKVREQRFPTTK